MAGTNDSCGEDPLQEMILVPTTRCVRRQLLRGLALTTDAATAVAIALPARPRFMSSCHRRRLGACALIGVRRVAKKKKRLRRQVVPSAPLRRRVPTRCCSWPAMEPDQLSHGGVGVVVAPPDLVSRTAIFSTSCRRSAAGRVTRSLAVSIALRRLAHSWSSGASKTEGSRALSIRCALSFVAFSTADAMASKRLTLSLSMAASLLASMRSVLLTAPSLRRARATSQRDACWT